MKKPVLYCIISAFILTGTGFTFDSFRLFINEFKPAGLANPYAVSTVESWFRKAVSENTGFILLSQPDNADFFLEANVDYDLTRYTVNLRFTESGSPTNILTDTLYTTNIQDSGSIMELVRHSVTRAGLLLRGLKLPPYTEGENLKNLEESLKPAAEKPVLRYKAMQARWIHYLGVLVLPLTYFPGIISNSSNMPEYSFLSYGLTFIPVSTLFFLPLTDNGWGIGFGMGTALFDYRTTFDTNRFHYKIPGFIQLPLHAGGFLPITASVPFYVEPGVLETDRQDFMLYFKWNWSLSIYSCWSAGIRYARSGLEISFGWYKEDGVDSAEFYRMPYEGLYLEISLAFGQYIIPGMKLPGSSD